MASRNGDTQVSRVVDYLRTHPTATTNEVCTGIKEEVASSTVTVARKRLGLRATKGPGSKSGSNGHVPRAGAPETDCTETVCLTNLEVFTRLVKLCEQAGGTERVGKVLEAVESLERMAS